MPVELVPLAFFSLELAGSAVLALNHHFAGEDVGVKPAFDRHAAILAWP